MGVLGARRTLAVLGMGSAALLAVLAVGPPAGAATAISFSARNYTATTAGVGEGDGSLASGDVTGDGFADIVAADPSGMAFSVLRNRGDGTFAARKAIATGVNTWGVTVADVDHDGRADVLAVDMSSSNNAQLQVWLGAGDGTFSKLASYPVGSSPQNVVVTDFNGDGHADAAVDGAFGGQGILMFLGRGDGTFRTAQNVPAGQTPTVLATGDFNADGKPDLATAESTYPSTALYILIGKGDGSFQPAVSYPVSSTPESIAVGDLNADGHADIATADAWTMDVATFYGRGDGTFSPARYVSGSAPTGIGIADFNRDATADLAYTSIFESKVFILAGGSGTYSAAGSYPAASAPQPIVIDDFNSDGRADVATAGTTPQSATPWTVNQVTVLTNTTP